MKLYVKIKFKSKEKATLFKNSVKSKTWSKIELFVEFWLMVGWICFSQLIINSKWSEYSYWYLHLRIYLD